jgi:hypothetical protein
LFPADDARHGRELWRITPDDPPPPTARVVGRYVFYNNSAFDAAEPAAADDPRVGDDFAIAPDKQPVLPGQAATFANVTSYTKGINGVMVDIANLPFDAILTPADFGGTWAPREVMVRRGAGAGGSDRVTLFWDDYNPASTRAAQSVVANGWLTVTVKANGHTGLARPDVFSFGNLIGDTGDSATNCRVNALDLAAVKLALNSSSSITRPADFNRDGKVNALDLGAAKANLNRSLSTAVPPPRTPAPPAPALALQRLWDEAPPTVLEK